MHEGQTDLRRAEMNPVRNRYDYGHDALHIMTYRGIVEDKGGSCIDRWCTGVCGRIDILPCVEL
jgi:hypothetical protein